MDDRFDGASRARDKQSDGTETARPDNSIADFNDLLKNDASTKLVHPKPGLPDLEVGPDANKPKEEFEPVVRHRLPDGTERYRFYRDDKDHTLEHEVSYQPKGNGFATWYREDGTKTHQQFFNWGIEEYVREGHVGVFHDLATKFNKIEEYAANGKDRTATYVFDRNGNLSSLRLYNERGGLNKLQQFRPDGTLQVETDYSGHTDKRRRYAREDDIRLKADPYIFRKPYLNEKDEVFPKL